MNRNLLSALALAFGSLGVAPVASAQQGIPPSQNWVFICDDPETDDDKFSNPFGVLRHRNDLFGISIGVPGTATFETCYDPSSLNVAGRIGFQIGDIGSIQDVAVHGRPIDDNMMLNPTMPYPAGSSGYAMIVRQDESGQNTLTHWGGTSLGTAFTGASDRYVIGETTVDNVRVRLRADLIGDAARLQWTMQNTGAAGGVGLYFGQHMLAAAAPEIPGVPNVRPMSFVRVPGRRPLVVGQRYARNPLPGGNELQLPSVVNFSISQALGYGLQIVNSPTEGNASSVPDQTPVDGLLLGDGSSLLGIVPSDPGMPQGITDDVAINSVGYVQKWEPTSVAAAGQAGDTRVITSYYKSTTGVSNYAAPYSVVVDAPQTIAVRDSSPNQFLPDVQTIRVYVDNTRGFSTVNQGIPLTNVRVTLDLPQGMYAENDPTETQTRMVKFIDRIEPTDSTRRVDPSLPLQYVDFQVRTSNNLFGPQQYRVRVEPQPGIAKELTGSINVASKPRLRIQAAANLVAAPWDFSNTSWASILGSGTVPLVPDVNFQAYEWDAAQQQYTIQTGPRRGFGTWIVSTVDAGFKPLGANPRTPQDLSTGAPLIELRPGWNLIANPYNYSIEIGQIVGVSGANNQQSETFEQLASQGIISQSLAYWDPNTQSYRYTQGIADVMLPNRGYWIFVNGAQNVTFSYPPVYQPFVPQGTGGIQQVGGWRLNLVARSAKYADDQTYVGIAATANHVRTGSVMKPPIAPLKDAISSSVAPKGQTTQFAQSLETKKNRHEWTWQVTSRGNGPMTLTWPNAKDIPSTVRLSIVPEEGGAAINPRVTPSITYPAGANTVRKFRVIAEIGDPQPLVGVVRALGMGRGFSTGYNISYQMLNAGNVTVKVKQNGRVIRTLLSGQNQDRGNRSVLWNLFDAANRRAARGVYDIEVTAENDGSTETKTIQVRVI